MLFILLTGLGEIHRIYVKNNLAPVKINHYAFPVLIYLLGFLVVLSILPQNMLVLIIPLTFLAALLELLNKKSNPVGRTGALLLSILYLSIPLIILHLMFFREVEFEAPKGFLIFSLFVIIWINDTFAYITGSLLGKHKLSSISPNKTWEGSFGGLVFSFVGAYALFLVFGNLELWIWFSLAIIIVVFGTLGDLFESMLKRSSGLKESGKIIPGHGGILDRLDSILIAAPFVFCFLYFILKYYAI